MPLFVPGARDGRLVGEAVVGVDVGGVTAQVVAVLVTETKITRGSDKITTLKVDFIENGKN